MKIDEAQRAIVAEWLELPPSARATEHQAAVFAMKKMPEYQLRSRGAGPYQLINGWLRRYVGKP